MFSQIMKIWSIFSASDSNNNNILDAYELKNLFWLFDSRKPSQERVERERKLMDDDENGTISWLEWLLYFCSIKQDSKGINELEYYDADLRALFEKADKTKTG